MEFHVSVSFEQKIEAGTYDEALIRALGRIHTDAVQPEYVSVYREKEEKE